MAHLTIHQSLAEIQKQYEEILQRPIYVSGYINDSNYNELRYYNYFIRHSEEEEYVARSFLNVYLSPFSFPFIKRELDQSVSRDKILDYELRRFCEPELSRQISFCFPLTEKEKTDWKRFSPIGEEQERKSKAIESQTKLGLRGGYTELSVIPSDVEMNFPELVPYIYQKKEVENQYEVFLAKKLKINNPSSDYDSEYCIAFAHSWCFETPQEKQTSWSYYESSQQNKDRCYIVDESIEFPIYTSLCPPGQYKSKQKQITNGYCRDMCFPIVFIQKPGKCIICQGAQNDRRHIAFSKEQIEQDVQQCYTCFQATIQDWNTLLSDVEKYQPINIKKI